MSKATTNIKPMMPPGVDEWNYKEFLSHESWKSVFRENVNGT